MMKYVAGCLLLLAGVIAVMGDCGRKPDGEAYWKAQAQKYQALYAEAATRVQHADTVWRVAKARVDSIRDTVPVWQHDTVYVREYVTRTDSALKACSLLADDCQAFRVKADQLIHSQEVELEALRGVNVAANRRAERYQRFTAAAFVVGGIIGAFIRGQ